MMLIRVLASLYPGKIQPSSRMITGEIERPNLSAGFISSFAMDGSQVGFCKVFYKKPPQVAPEISRRQFP